MKNHRVGTIGLMVVSLVFVVTLAAQAGHVKAHQDVAANSHAKITATKAEAVVLNKYHGKIVEKTKLENEEGTWQYGVMVKTGKTLREVMVNAKSGKIDSVEVTNASTEKKEAAAETSRAKKISPAHGQKHPARAK